MNDRPPDRCSACGVTWTRADWEALPFIGVQNHEGEEYELRQCSRCRSTRSRKIRETPRDE